MKSTIVYLISSDATWAEHLDESVRDERLGRVQFFPVGRGALSAYRTALPDVVIFDLREERRDVTVAMTMIREIFPRMAAGGVIVIGSADPADRVALREEREQLALIQLAEYLPRNTPDSFYLERLHALQQRALEFRQQAELPAGSQGLNSTLGTPAATPRAPEPAKAPRESAPPAGLPTLPVPDGDSALPVVNSRIRVLLSLADQQSALLEALVDVGASPLRVGENGTLAESDEVDFLIVDSVCAERHASLLTQMRRSNPCLRIIQIPDEGDRGMRRLSRDISALLAATASGPAELASQIRARVSQDNVVPVLLLVEDEQNIRELTAHYLLLQGYEVHQAEDGVEAMSLFKARRPALILSDVYMPRMNGFKLLLEVKNRVPELPMLMMTGYSSAAEVLNSSKYRNVSFLAKPFRLSELGERIRSMLGSAS